MNLEEAKKIKTNDSLTTVFGDSVVVFDKFNEENNEEVTAIIFTVINPTNNRVTNYYHQILYTNTNNIDESEKSFISWMKENRTEQIEFSDLVLLRTVFLSGFNLGKDTLSIKEEPSVETQTNESQ